MPIKKFTKQQQMAYLKTLPKKRMGCGVLIFNNRNELLVVKPSYKDHWSIPGGVVDKDESPRATGLRETQEEIGLKLKQLRFLCIDYVAASETKDENLQFLFYGGKLTAQQIAKIKIDGEEIIDFKFVKVKEALKLFSAGGLKLKDRLPEALKALKYKDGGVYFENSKYQSNF